MTRYFILTSLLALLVVALTMVNQPRPEPLTAYEKVWVMMSIAKARQSHLDFVNNPEMMSYLKQYFDTSEEQELTWAKVYTLTIKWMEAR